MFQLFKSLFPLCVLKIVPVLLTFSPALKEGVSHFLSKLNPIPPVSSIAPSNFPLFTIMLTILSLLTSLQFTKNDQDSPILKVFLKLSLNLSSFLHHQLIEE